jgi:amidohydrolase
VFRVLYGGRVTSLFELYQDLHAHPELAFAEHRTAGIVADRLTDLGLDVTTGVGGTGVVGVLHGSAATTDDGGAGPVVWLRADIDGLPVHEQTGLPYASSHRMTDADGTETFTMHACGHDMHITWLVGTLERLVATRDEWSGTVVAIFQPAEEVIGGARAMVADGLVDRFPKPDVVLGQHTSPEALGRISVGSGPVMASSDRFTITFRGRGAHGSAPQMSRDPIVAAASAILRLQTIVSREVPPREVAVVTVGSVHGGTRPNIIPDSVVIEISTRSKNEETRTLVDAAIRRIVAAESAAGGLDEPLIERKPGANVLVNDPDAAARVVAALDGVVPDVFPGDSSLGVASEDVGELATAAGAPIVYWFTATTDPAVFERGEDAPTNHSPFFAPDAERSIPIGIDALTAAAREFLG